MVIAAIVAACSIASAQAELVNGVNPDPTVARVVVNLKEQVNQLEASAKINTEKYSKEATAAQANACKALRQVKAIQAKVEELSKNGITADQLNKILHDGNYINVEIINDAKSENPVTAGGKALHDAIVELSTSTTTSLIVSAANGDTTDPNAIKIRNGLNFIIADETKPIKDEQKRMADEQKRMAAEAKAKQDKQVLWDWIVRGGLLLLLILVIAGFVKEKGGKLANRPSPQSN